MKLTELKQLVGNNLKQHKLRAGIYFLVHEGEVTYVGKSKNIAHRIVCHEIHGLKKPFDSVYFIETPDASALKAREVHYIRLCKPKLNVRMKEPDNVLELPRLLEGLAEAV